MIKRYDEVTGMEAQILSGSREAAEFMLVSFCGEPPPLHELEAREARYAELSARSKLDNMGYRMARAAIFTFLRALKSGDEASSAKALENLMRLMTDSSKGAPRRDYLESEIVFRASVAAGYAKLGDLYEKLGRKDKALEAYRKAEISPAGQWYVAEKIKKRSN
jgi:tetratricopeptide (TPR) repeat protein